MQAELKAEREKLKSQEQQQVCHLGDGGAALNSTLGRDAAGNRIVKPVTVLLCTTSGVGSVAASCRCNVLAAHDVLRTAC